MTVYALIDSRGRPLRLSTGGMWTTVSLDEAWQVSGEHGGAWTLVPLA